MNAEQLRGLQAPLKARYKENPDAARVTLQARGELDPEAIACRVATFAGPVEAGLHPATGGEGRSACSGDMLLEALVGCAGVTLTAVATALGVPIRKATITAEGDLDVRGTLGVDRETPVGIQNIRLRFDLDTDATEEQLQKLLTLTERYCVVFQTLRRPPEVQTSHRKIQDS